MKFKILNIMLGILLLTVSFCFGHGDEEVSEDIETVKSTGYVSNREVER